MLAVKRGKRMQHRVTEFIKRPDTVIGMYSASDKVIITAAITGAVHTPTMSAHLPITPRQIADEAVGAAEAGAAMVHIHVRDPENGKPSSNLDLFRQVLSDIRGRSDVIVNTTTGGGLGMTLQERLMVVPTFRPEVASFNMGSMNFGSYQYLSKVKEWKYAWERPYIESSRDYIFKNTFGDMEQYCKTMRENETKPELECYDVSHIYNAKRLIDEGKLETPVHVQFVLGITGGIGASADDLVSMKHAADNLFGGANYSWSVAAAGKFQFGSCVTAATLGGHVRVGLEDNLYIGKGILAKSNSEQVEKIKKLVYEVTGRENASPAEARKMLGLKGKDKTKL
jgi:uncharacterized protein (DUF849 family)